VPVISSIVRGRSIYVSFNHENVRGIFFKQTKILRYCIEYVNFSKHCLYSERFLTLLAGSRVRASRRLVHRRLRGAYEFCRWISMLNGRKRLELREVINFVDRLTALYFTASSAIHAWKFVYDLSAVVNSYQRKCLRKFRLKFRD
jgi:hypothetical protein